MQVVALDVELVEGGALHKDVAIWNHSWTIKGIKSSERLRLESAYRFALFSLKDFTSVVHVPDEAFAKTHLLSVIPVGCGLLVWCQVKIFSNFLLPRTFLFDQPLVEEDCFFKNTLQRVCLVFVGFKIKESLRRGLWSPGHCDLGWYCLKDLFWRRGVILATFLGRFPDPFFLLRFGFGPIQIWWTHRFFGSSQFVPSCLPRFLTGRAIYRWSSIGFGMLSGAEDPFGLVAYFWNRRQLRHNFFHRVARRL